MVPEASLRPLTAKPSGATENLYFLIDLYRQDPTKTYKDFRDYFKQQPVKFV